MGFHTQSRRRRNNRAWSDNIQTVVYDTDTPDDSNARSTDVGSTLRITGKILTATDGDKADDTMKLATWSLVPAEKADCYRKVTLEVISADQVVRKIYFPNAFVVDYNERFGDCGRTSVNSVCSSSKRKTKPSLPKSRAVIPTNNRYKGAVQLRGSTLYSSAKKVSVLMSNWYHLLGCNASGRCSTDQASVSQISKAIIIPIVIREVPRQSSASSRYSRPMKHWGMNRGRSRYDESLQRTATGQRQSETTNAHPKRAGTTTRPDFDPRNVQAQFERFFLALNANGQKKEEPGNKTSKKSAGHGPQNRGNTFLTDILGRVNESQSCNGGCTYMKSERTAALWSIDIGIAVPVGSHTDLCVYDAFDYPAHTRCTDGDGSDRLVYLRSLGEGQARGG